MSSGKRPATILELAETASKGLSWSPRYSLRTWLKSTYTLVTKAKECENTDLPHAFVLTARAATIILEKIPTHPDYATLNPAQKANLRTNGETYLKALSSYKVLLTNDFNQWLLRNPGWSLAEEQKTKQAQRLAEEHSRAATPESSSQPPSSKPAEVRGRRDSIAKRNVRFEGDDTSPDPPASGQIASLGGRLSSVDETARSLDRMSLAPRPLPSESSQSAYYTSSAAARPPIIPWNSGPTPGSAWNGHTYQSYHPTYPSPYAEHLHSPASLVPHSHISYPSLSDPSSRTSQQPYTPAIPTPNAYDYLSSLPPPPRPKPPAFPALPPGGQDYYSAPSQNGSSANGSLITYPTPVVAAALPTAQLVPPPAVAKPIEPYDGRVQGLRRLNIPTSILTTFLRLAQKNTTNKIETCGLLLGTSRERHGSLKEEELVVEVLLIPKQTGTSDTCQMEEEESVIDVQLERGLIVFGWVHSHPVQDLFMSSLDLHTHCPYQSLLAEAVAIVCAPRSDPSYGIFRLTEPGGLETIMKCKKPGSFHPHPSVPGGLYTDCNHVRMLKGADLEVIDLR